MGSLFRSLEMVHSQIILHTETAYNCVSELGELGIVQFEDSNANQNAFQRKFINEIRRCEEMERKLRYIEKQLKEAHVEIKEPPPNHLPIAPLPREVVDLEAQIENNTNELHEIKENTDELRDKMASLYELKIILQKTHDFFNDAAASSGVASGGMTSRSDQLEEGFEKNPAAAGERGIQFITGVIERTRLAAFERLLWRYCHGNVYLRHADINEMDVSRSASFSDNISSKDVFIVFFQGDQLRNRVLRICESFHARIYPCPDGAQDRRDLSINVVSRIGDCQLVMDQSLDHRRRLLDRLADSLADWSIKVRKMKAIYHTLNLFNLNAMEKCMIGECWIAADDVTRVRSALLEGMRRSHSTVQPILEVLPVPPGVSPPTYHRLNKLTAPFQALVDAYGACCYQEANPTPFMVISFPFLFAVMFGDAGHAVVMLLFALWMVLTERRHLGKRSDNEIWNMIFGGRYIILLMAVFSVYTGLVYNDVYSLSLNLFGSAWYPDKVTLPMSELKKINDYGLDANVTGFYRGNPYWFGIDPVWQHAKNKISFTNSIKMKMSIILGIAQMTFGVFISLLNYIYFKNTVNIVFDFVPQLIFISAIFGYLCVQIFLKWVLFGPFWSNCAPSLLIGLINMFMFKQEKMDPLNVCAGRTHLFAGQQTLQTVLVVLAVICVPWMLAKPFYLWYRHNSGRAGGDQSERSEKRRRQFQHKKLEENEQNGNTLIKENGGASTTTVTATFDESDLLAGGGVGGDGGGGEAHRLVKRRSGDAENMTQSPAADDAAAVDTPDEACLEERYGDVAAALDEPFHFDEVFVKQAIHTIEYCLGCISSTASYLRLWALSLAHSQLSEVLWSMVMHIPLSFDSWLGVVLLVPVFIAWATLTVGILLLMEGLSAFLHALRLHWVEFQYKFYGADGHNFAPLNLNKIALELNDV